MRRMELLAALISARLFNTVRQALENQVSFESIWSDSATVLHWLKDDRSYKQFASNRTKAISKLIHSDAWGYCPTEDIPADIGSRGLSATELKDNELWWTRPKWPEGPPENYPQQFTLKELESDECFKESAKEQVTNLQVNIDEVHKIDLDKIIDISKSSSCNRLLRVTVLVLRSASNLICRVRGKNDLIKSEDLTKEEIEQAESTWIKTAQRSVKEAKNLAQLQKQLGLYVESDGIIRCCGRICNAALKFETRFSAIITDHPLASLVI